MNADRHQRITRAVAKFFFGCNIAFINIESEYFLEMVRELNPEYIPPNRKALAGPILKNMYNEFCSSIRQEQTQYGILFVDGWKNSVANSKNVVTTLRTTNGENIFFDSYNFSDVRETGEELSNIVNECIDTALQKYNIQIYAVLTDNASNMINMGNRLNVWHLTCNSHSGNLLFKSLNDREFDEKISNIVKDFRSPNLEQRLLNVGGKKMIVAGETRWCSRRDSYRRCLENIPFLRQVVENNQLEDREYQYNFRNGVIESILDNSFVLDLINELLTHDPICNLVNVCQSSNCNIAYATEKWLRLQLPGENAFFENILQQRLSKVITKYGLAANFIHPSYMGRGFLNNPDYIAKKNKFFQENLSQQGLEQLSQYENQTGIFQVLFRQRYTDCKNFWKAAGRIFPELSNLAIRLLSIPASTGDLERLFSEWTLVHSKIRNRLKEETSKMLIALYYNYRLKYARLYEDDDED